MAVTAKTVNIRPDVLNDLSSRFLINLSNEDRADPIKLCSHIEQAHWYYLDLVRSGNNSSLPGCNLKEFMQTVFQHCPWLVKASTVRDLDKLIADWKANKYRKPVRGAILVSQDWTKCLLVQGYPGTSWGFPKGKLEEGERDVDAAVREVYEETGFDIRSIVQEDLFLEATVNDCNARLYVILGIPEDTKFGPKTRNEIKEIKWFNIKDLPSSKNDEATWQAFGKSPNNFFMVIPFIGKLRKLIQAQKKSKIKGVSASFLSSKPVQSHSQTRNQRHHSQQQQQQQSGQKAEHSSAPVSHHKPVLAGQPVSTPPHTAAANRQTIITTQTSQPYLHTSTFSQQPPPHPSSSSSHIHPQHHQLSPKPPLLPMPNQQQQSPSQHHHQSPGFSNTLLPRQQILGFPNTLPPRQQIPGFPNTLLPRQPAPGFPNTLPPHPGFPNTLPSHPGFPDTLPSHPGFPNTLPPHQLLAQQHLHLTPRSPHGKPLKGQSPLLLGGKTRQHHQPATYQQSGKTSTLLKPAKSLTCFKFDKDAILRAFHS